MQPHRWQPIRLRHPWDSPGKNTGVGCHFLFQCMKVKSESEIAQSCPTLCDPMDCSLPGSSIHGIFQVRVLEWGATAFSGYCGQESLRGNGVATIVNKRVWSAVLGGNLKNDRMRSRSWMVLWRPARHSRTNTPKRCPFHHRELECKSRKSRDTWNNRQVWPWSTKWSRATANRVLSREHTGHNKHPDESTHGHHQMVIPKSDYILCS